MSNGYILLAGDLSITKSNENYFCEGSVENIVGEEIRKEIKDSNLFIINHEMALTNYGLPIFKRGATLKANPSCVKGLKNLGVNLCLLANNHVIDYGKEGINETRKVLKNADIDFIGAGDNLSEAKRPYKYMIDGKSVTIMNFADHEFNKATEYYAGVNVFDPFMAFDDIAKEKEQCDYLIVVFHGGIERYRYPSPLLQKICRKMIDKGADFVTCQHSHCIGTWEEYENSFIFYGQGNFLFDDGEDECYQTGIILKIFPENRKISFVPICREKNGVRLATELESKEILNSIELRRKEISIDGIIEKKYNEFSKETARSMYNALLCNNLIIRAINRLTRGWLYNRMFRKVNRIRIQNILESNALFEILLEVIKQK